MSRQKGAQQPLYANYWENDTTMNPVIVRIDHFRPKKEHQIVVLPNGAGTRQVHIHELGVPHVAC